MACHEITALRLGLMRLMGIVDEAERQHELSELGAAAQQGPFMAIMQAEHMTALQQAFGHALADLEEKVAATGEDHPKVHYYRALLIATKKTEMELAGHLEGLRRMWRDLDEMHHLIHEIYP